MEKRTLLAIAISFAIVVAWSYLFNKENITEKPEVPQEQKTVPAKQESAPNLDVMNLKASDTTQKPGELIVIETPLLQITFNTKGAQLTSVKLNKYKQGLENNSEPVEIIKTPMPSLYMKGGFSDENLIFTPSQSGKLSSNQDPIELSFTAPAGQDIIIKKVFTVDPKSYLLGFKTITDNNSQKAMSMSFNVLMNDTFPIDQETSSYIFEGPVILYGKKLEEFDISKLNKIGSIRDFPGEIKWFGFEDKFFLKTIISKDPLETSLSIKRTDEKTLGIHYEVSPVTIEPASSSMKEYLIFIGPKELETLKASGYSLNKALDFGFFDIIAKPLLMSMNWIYMYTNSYGWSIILLTIIIKMLLYPLTVKSFTSMKGLQKIQPLMKEIQNQYKDDKQKMNQELMKLYSEHKINPMGGCLPMLLQIPILFALYKVFYSAIELRHTSFHIYGTWLPDLSAMDPYYITPILMGLSQLALQKMTPAAGDPMQQKMMLIMPIVFTAISINFPSGLLIYWLISNVLSIVQQAYINRKHT